MHKCEIFSIGQISRWHRRHFTSVEFAFTIHLALKFSTKKCFRIFPGAQFAGLPFRNQE
jgi:hypothetical protein